MLKRLASIGFLIIFLFNVGGYYLVYLGVSHNSNQQLLERIDAELYDNHEVVTLTIPLSLPYPIHEIGYQRVDGEFEFQGEYLKLAKQKYENDTLYLVCVRNPHAKRLANAMKDFTKLINDIPLQSKGPLNLLSKLSKDYKASDLLIVADSVGKKIEINYSFIKLDYARISIPVPAPPPDLLG